MTWRLRNFTLPLIFLLYAGCSEDRYGRLQSVDTEMEYSSAGFGTPCTAYTVGRNATITKEIQNSHGQVAHSFRRHLLSHDWEQFQRKVAQLHVFNWKPSYSPGSEIYDGGGWQVILRNGPRTVLSRGINAGPSPSDPKRTVDAGQGESGDDLLQTAIEELWQHSSR